MKRSISSGVRRDRFLPGTRPGIVHLCRVPAPSHSNKVFLVQLGRFDNEVGTLLFVPHTALARKVQYFVIGEDHFVIKQSAGTRH